MNRSAMKEEFAATMPATPGARESAALQTIALAGSVAALIDLLFAFLFFGIGFGVAPMRVMQSIASGFFGAAAFDGGASSAAIGVLAHFFILNVAASFYYLAARRMPWLTRHALVSGVLFGLAIYVVMTFVVVPLSAASHGHSPWTAVLGQFAIHPLLGVAIALIVQRGAGRL